MTILIRLLQINIQNTVKPVYNDHLEDNVSAVVIDRWLLYRTPVYNSQNC